MRGSSHRGRRYKADDGALAAWVHNALTESFLVAYREFGPRRLTWADEDRFVAEQARIGRLLDAAPLPTSAASLSSWIECHPDIAPSPGMEEAVRFLARPPLPVAARPVARAMFEASVATLPPRIRAVLGVRPRLGALGAGRAAVRFVRWAVGDSPEWRRALLRTGRPIPPDARFIASGKDAP